MSTTSRNSYLHRRIDSNRSTTRPRGGSRARPPPVGHDDAYSFALRIAYLNHLLQPKGKRKQWVPAPKAPARSGTSVVELVSQLASSGAHTVKLPHGFRGPLEKKIIEVVQGTSPLPGYNDAAVKRTFAQAWTAITEKSFQKSADKDRKIEPYILMFYTSATKAAMSGALQAGISQDDHQKMLSDRHVALFVRLVSHMLREQGHDRDRPELTSRLSTIERKLLTNDQNLAGQNGSMIEVQLPMSYDVKDMPLVLLVSRIFGRSNSEVQADIDSRRNEWTEEAALKDIKTYQQRLNSGAPGALRCHDFDLDEAFEEWKKSEAPHLSQIILDILTAKPELAKTSSLANDKPLPSRPQSIYSEDQSYADLSRALSSPDSSFDPSTLSSLSLDESGSSIRAVEGDLYTFIPPDPRGFYKAILQSCVTYDYMHGDPAQPYTPLAKQTLDFLIELSVYWRVPQFSRLVTFVEVTTKKFLDQEFKIEELAICLDFVKSPGVEQKKPPHLHMYASGLNEINRNYWTIQDFAAYRQTLQILHDALLRDLYDHLKGCFGPSPPNIGTVMGLLESHVQEDEAFSPRNEQLIEFARQVSEALEASAREIYRSIVEQRLPEDAEEWQFSNVVQMGKDVIGRITKIHKRYRRAPEIMGVTPIPILAETMLPLFEQDAEHIIKKSIEKVQEGGEEVDIQDGFDLYSELVTLRTSHRQFLPDQPFGFDIESLLVDFVWRWVRNAEGRMTDFVENAIKQDKFQVRSNDPYELPQDSERHSSSIIDLFMLFNQTARQIDELSWDNELHHARFMTTLAHAFASGIEKYCEEVGKLFSADLDRLTPEEIAAASRTTQERFLQYAKEAWNTKEKPEPFQFSSKSFVMLNNVEYAKQELDKLEQSMQVDTCAEIIRQEEGPKPVTRRPNKYNFTVKLIEAEDLKACDPNGFSDPYVVLVDERQKRLHKTRVVRKSLNPRWDESRDITVTSPITIIATVWDDDMFGDHDFVGRTSFKLDPAHFRNYLPQEIWLDLDTQGRILIKISMEGERDDIEFQFGKAFRDLKRTEQTMVRKITDKLRDQISIAISNETLRSLVRGNGLGASMTSLWKRQSAIATGPSRADIEASLQPLFEYFNENFSIMKLTLTNDTMRAVMLRLWKEVLMACENLMVPPLSDKPSEQRPLGQKELDIVFNWLEQLFHFFNHKDETGQELGVASNDLKSPKWHELKTLNFFYFEDTNNLIRESERMAAANAARAQQLLTQQNAAQTAAQSRLAAPSAVGGGNGGAHVSAFGSMGTIRRGKSIMMSRNLGTMRRAKEEKRKEAQADPSDDMIMRILRMRPEASGYLKDRSRQKERQSAAAAAAMIVKNSVNQGWTTGNNHGAGASFGRNSLPRR